LGIDVNAVEAVGEKFEIEELGEQSATLLAQGDVLEGGPQPVASPRAGETATASVHPSADGVEARAAALVSPRRDVSAPANPTTSKRRRGV
jgi:hypothetical protein